MALGVIGAYVASNWAKIAMTIASAAYSYYSNKKMLQDLKRRPTADDRPSATTTRGAFLPLLIGRRRLAPVISWLEGRTVDKYGQTFESAGHLICIGPAAFLHRIFENGKIIFAQVINPTQTPSGSTLSTSNGRSFTIYWGEETPGSTDVPSEIGSLFPRVCYIKWNQILLEGGFWPDFTYDIEVEPISNTDGVGEVIVGKPPTLGDFSDIKDTENGFPGQNFLEVDGDRTDDFSGETNALIKFEDVPEDMTASPWTTLITEDDGTPGGTGTMTRDDVAWNGVTQTFDFNKFTAEVDTLVRTVMPLTNFPGEGKQVRASFDCVADLVDDVNLLIVGMSSVYIKANGVEKGRLDYIGMIPEFGDTTPEAITGDVRFTKYDTELEGVKWVHYDVVFTVPDNDEEEESWELLFSLKRDGAGVSGLRLDVANLETLTGVEYDIRRVTLLDTTIGEALDADLSLWTNQEYTNGLQEYINNSDPDYETPPAEATDTSQNRIEAFTPSGNEVYSEDSRTTYPNETGTIQWEAYVKMTNGVLQVSANAGSGDIWFAHITAVSGLWTYVTSSTATEVVLETTTETDWFKVTIKHTVQASESAYFGNAYFFRVGMESANVTSEVWFQNQVYSSSTEAAFKTRIELNEEINVLVDDTGEVAPISSEVIGGANAAGALHQMLFQPYPYGAGLNKSDYDMTSLGLLSEVVASESLPSSILADDGKDLEAMVANILQDAGAMMYWDIETGLFKFQAIREVDDEDIIALSVLKRRPTITVRHENYVSNQFVFSFADVTRKYKETTLIYDNDGEISTDYGQTKRSVQVRIPTTISFEAAKVIAERRAQEEMGKPSVLSIKVLRSEQLAPGDVITTAYTNQNLRIVSVVDDQEDNQVIVECVSEFYGLPDASSVVDPGGGEGVVGDAPDPDEAFRILELPRFLSANQNKLFSPRIRSALDIVGARLFFSTNGSSYNEDITSLTALAGGVLNEAMAEDTEQLMDSGPVINILGPDTVEILNLVGSESDFRRGRQVVLIGDEIFFCEGVTVLSTTQLRLGRLIRGRYATKIEQHLIGENVYIWQDDDITEANLLPVAGQDLFLKTQPFNSTDSVDLADVTPDNRTVLGDGTRPPRPYGINTPEKSKAWEAGEDVVLDWKYRNGNVPGAGEVLAGESSVNALPEGTFTLRIYDSTGTTLKRTETGLTSPTYTYTNANLVSDFSGEPTAILVKVVNIASTGLTSDEAEQQIEKV